MKPKILMIENSAYDMEVYAELLRDQYDLTFAWSIVQASEMQMVYFDLIILDVMMPPEDLFGLAETEKGLLTGLCFFDKFLKGKFVPIIFMTAATGAVLAKIEEHRRKFPQILAVMRKADMNPIDFKHAIDEWARDR